MAEQERVIFGGAFMNEAGQRVVVQTSDFDDENIFDLTSVPIMTPTITKQIFKDFIENMSILSKESEKFALINDHVLRHCKSLLLTMSEAVYGAQLLKQQQITFTTSKLPVFHEASLKALCTYRFSPIITTEMLKFGNMIWRPQTHGFFHIDQRMWVYELLKCWEITTSYTPLHTIPRELLFAIFDWICRPPWIWLRRCFTCGKTDRMLKRCSHCKVAYFCDQVCQKQGYKKHSSQNTTHQKQEEEDIIANMAQQMCPQFVQSHYGEHVHLLEGGFEI